MIPDLKHAHSGQEYYNADKQRLTNTVQTLSDEARAQQNCRNKKKTKVPWPKKALLSKYKKSQRH